MRHMERHSGLEDHMNNIWFPRIKEVGAFWTHSGIASHPHIWTTLKNHSNEYFNGYVFGQNPPLLDEACKSLASFLVLRFPEILDVDRIIGPAMGAICIADGVARHLSNIRQKPCLSGFVEKEENNGKRRMVFKRMNIYHGETVLIVDNTINMGSSVHLTAEAVKEAGGRVLPVFGAIMNRSAVSIKTRIVSLAHIPATQWKPNKCPLCAKNSEVIEPQLPRNWKRLQGL